MEIITKQYDRLKELSMQSIRMHAGNKMGINLLAMGLAALGVGIFFTMAIHSNPGSATIKTLYVTSMLLLGFYHLFSLPKILHTNEKEALELRFIYTLLLAACIFIGNILFFVLVGFYNKGMALAGAAGMLLPSALLLSWNYFKGLMPAQQFRPWTPPLEMTAPTATIFLNSIQIQMQLKMHWYDATEKAFLFTVPGRLELGEMFHRFLMDKQDDDVHIQLYDKEQEAFSWQFMLKRRSGNLLLNPDLSLTGNNINENDIIIAQRVQTEVAAIDG